MVGMMRRAWAWLVDWLDRPLMAGRPEVEPTAPRWETEGVVERMQCGVCGLIQEEAADCIRCHPRAHEPPVHVSDGPVDEPVILGKVIPSLVCPRCKRSTQMVGDKLFAEEVTCSTCHATIVNLRPRPVPPLDLSGYDDWHAAPVVRAERMDGPDEDYDDEDDLDDDDDDDEEEEDFDDDDEEETEPFHAPAVVEDAIPTITRVEMKIEDFEFVREDGVVFRGLAGRIYVAAQAASEPSRGVFHESATCQSCEKRSSGFGVSEPLICKHCGKHIEEPPPKPPVVPRWVSGRADV